MDPDDPFFQPKPDDRTVIRPNPGGKRSEIRRPASRPTASSSNYNNALPRLGKLNPLEAAASGILALFTQLNSSRSHPDPQGLKHQLTHEIKAFQNHALHTGIEQKTTFTARYVLCTAVDEAILNTPWGHSSGWAQQSLLNTFHKEVAGGEKFFQILKSLSKNPIENIDLLELMYLCLSMGFQGKYRVTNGGKDKVQQIRSWLYQIIDKERPRSDPELSPHWKGVAKKQSLLTDYIPFWVYAAVAAGVLGLMFFGFLMHLNNKSDPVFKKILTTEFKIPKPPEYRAPQIAVQPTPPPVIVAVEEITLTDLLQPEIQAGKVNVIESSRTSTVTIQGDSLFRPGRASINNAVFALIQRIAESLNQLDGQILITGHSDSDPIRNARFPSNFHLSQARAEAFASVLHQYIDTPSRTTIEGRADTEPVASNDSKAGKARNRRVEITLFK